MGLFRILWKIGWECLILYKNISSPSVLTNGFHFPFGYEDIYLFPYFLGRYFFANTRLYF